jgi:hypothetical protein
MFSALVIVARSCSPSPLKSPAISRCPRDGIV